MAKSKINFEEFGPITSFSTSIKVVSCWVIDSIFLAMSHPVVFVLIGIYDGYRKCGRFRKTEENER